MQSHGGRFYRRPRELIYILGSQLSVPPSCPRRSAPANVERMHYTYTITAVSRPLPPYEGRGGLAFERIYITVDLFTAHLTDPVERTALRSPSDLLVLFGFLFRILRATTLQPFRVSPRPDRLRRSRLLFTYAPLTVSKTG